MSSLDISVAAFGFCEMRSPEEWIDETTMSLDQMTQRDRKMRVALFQAAKQALLIEIYNYKDITL